MYDYDNGTVFADHIIECEKNGDYIINVVESRLRATRNGIRYKGIQLDTDSKTVTPDDVIVNARTVDVNITRIRKKIEPYADHLTTRAGYGYSFQE
ncbi:MAG: helix-turn-helix domain-containing protein [Bacteroidaceae bacterium]|nr:helix-turn-helix domain-containing protein [Bacteroidaceae bacterium]